MEIEKQNDVIQIYKKERIHEEENFGDYSKDENLNVTSFLTFIDLYLTRAKTRYIAPWNKKANLPPWLKNSKELRNGTRAPVEVYECLIKIMALAGAALETCTDLDPKYWRKKEFFLFDNKKGE